MLCAKFGWNWLNGSGEDFQFHQCIFDFRNFSFQPRWVKKWCISNRYNYFFFYAFQSTLNNIITNIENKMVRKSKLQISNHDVINDTLLSVKLCIFHTQLVIVWSPCWLILNSPLQLSTKLTFIKWCNMYMDFFIDIPFNTDICYAQETACVRRQNITEWILWQKSTWNSFYKYAVNDNSASDPTLLD